MKCQHEGCEHEGEECTIKDDKGEDVVDGHYCSEHSALHGFCPCCGAYWGGICSFEERGICDYCFDDLQEEDDEWDDFAHADIDDEPEDDCVGSCDNCGVNVYRSV